MVKGFKFLFAINSQTAISKHKIKIFGFTGLLETYLIFKYIFDMNLQTCVN